MKNKFFLIAALGVAFCATANAQCKLSQTEDKPFANFEMAKKFKEFGLGGKGTRVSLSVWPREINKTDNFWYEFETAKGKDLKEARANAYAAVEWIDFENKYYRHDIGKAIDEA